jgi:hypothetical protein
MTTRHRTAVATAVLIAAAVGLPVTAGAAASTPRFLGSCTLTGTDTFAPPLTLTSGAGTADAVATGTCSGTLTDAAGTRSVSAAPARYEAHAVSDSLSCGGGIGFGRGTLTINATTISFTFAEPQVTVVSLLSLSGTSSGSAIGVASVAGPTNPAQLALACFGSGITRVPIALSLVSLTGIAG